VLQSSRYRTRSRPSRHSSVSVIWNGSLEAPPTDEAAGKGEEGVVQVEPPLPTDGQALEVVQERESLLDNVAELAQALDVRGALAGDHRQDGGKHHPAIPVEFGRRRCRYMSVVAEPVGEMAAKALVDVALLLGGPDVKTDGIQRLHGGSPHPRCPVRRPFPPRKRSGHRSESNRNTATPRSVMPWAWLRGRPSAQPNAMAAGPNRSRSSAAGGEDRGPPACTSLRGVRDAHPHGAGRAGDHRGPGPKHR
jgi:hypothetical protein